MRHGRRTGLLVWALVLVAAGTAMTLGAGRARAATARAATAPPACILRCPTTTTTTTTVAPTTTTAPPTTVPTSTPTSVASNPYPASFVPCGSNSGPCTEEPRQIAVSYPGGPAAAVEVGWNAQGRAAAAPDPTATSVDLRWSDGTQCGATTRCWAWPAGLTNSSFVLNGSYQVVACGTFTNNRCGATFPAQVVKLAAPPGPPTQVFARSSGSQVTLSWQPPAPAPPDLAGYTVARNGRAVYGCSTDGLGPAAGVRCPQALTVTDRPGDGRFTYAVSAVRLGADTASRDTVSSTATGASGGAVSVPGPVADPAAPGGGGGAGNPGFTPSPIIGSVGVIPAQGSAAGLTGDAPSGQGLGGAGAAPELGAPGTPQNLQYAADNPVVGRSSPLALKVDPAGSNPDVVPAGVLALGVLLLAIAAHFLYLRTQLGVLQARRGRPERPQD